MRFFSPLGGHYIIITIMIMYNIHIYIGSFSKSLYGAVVIWQDLKIRIELYNKNLLNMQKYSRRLRFRLIQNGFPLFFLPTAVFLLLPRSEGPSFSVFFRLRPKHFPHYLDLFNGSQRVEIILILFGFFSISLTSPSLCLSLSLSVRPSLYLSPPLYAVHYNTTCTLFAP